jgi:hypothetical protein
LRSWDTTRDVKGDVVVPAATAATKPRTAILEETLTPVVSRQITAHVRNQSHAEMLASVVKRACLLNFLRKADIRLLCVHDASQAHASRRREIDEVETVIDPQPHVCDKEVERPVLQALTRGWEVSAGDHQSDRPRHALEERTSGRMRFDKQEPRPDRFDRELGSRRMNRDHERPPRA